MACETDAKFWSDLYTLEITSDECLSKVRTVLNCPSKIGVARSFQGSNAGAFVDFLDRVLEAHLPLEENLRQRCLRLLSKICEAQRIIPTSYILRPELIRVGSFQDCGGFSDVSDGEYPGYTVAIKDLRMNKNDFDKVFKRFCREIVGWKHLSHQNILPLLGVSVSTDSHCFRILSEWMPNGNLVGFTRSNPEANRLQLLSEVASGVAYLHRVGITHGDLKGANILVDKMCIARVGDFGSMTIGNMGTKLFSESVDHSVGTISWMSPELLGASGADFKTRVTRESDCYALGMVMYEVLTGLRPFHHLPFLRIVVVVVTGGRPEKPHDAESLGFSNSLWELVQLCWSKESSERPTAQRLLDHLSGVSHTWVPRTENSTAESNTDSDSSSLFSRSLTNCTRGM